MFAIDTENISLNEEEISNEKVKHKVRQNWPHAVIALESLQNIVKNPIVKIVIGIVIAVGNSIYDRVENNSID